MSASSKAQHTLQGEAFVEANKAYESLVLELRSERAQGMTHSEVENLICEHGNELMRLLYQGYLDSLGNGPAIGSVRNHQGVELTHRVEEGKNLETIFGTVRVERLGYRQEEVSTIYPLDARLNLPARKYSLGVERRSTLEALKSSFTEAIRTVQGYTGACVPRRQLEEIVVRGAVDFDAFYERQQVVPPKQTGPLLVLSADGKGIVMRKEDLREATRKAAEQQEHKLTTRLSKGEKKNRKRMAEVAAVYTIQPHLRKPADIISKLRPVGSKRVAPKPENKRVWASVEKDAQDVIEEVFQEALRRDPDRDKAWVGLVDGNRDQISAFKRLSKRIGVALFLVVDYIHALEYLWKAARALHGDTAGAEDWVLERALKLLHGKVSDVAAGIRRSATLQGLEGAERETVDTCCDFLLNNAAYMKYDVCLRRGYPIATGVIEGACRHLVNERMGISGARWGLLRAEAVLRLRSLYLSGDFEEYWMFHERQEYARNHAARYFRGQLPKVEISSRSHLRVVK
jgi:hypothetical protein